MSGGTRLRWAVGVTLDSERTTLSGVEESAAPVFRVRGYNRLDDSFALVGDTPRGRLSLWLEPDVLERFRAVARDLPAQQFVLIEGRDELWREHAYRVPLNDDERARIEPLL